MAAGRRKQRLFYLEVGQTADSERSLGGQTDGRDHRPPQGADDYRLHQGIGSSRIVSTRSSLTGFRPTGILFFSSPYAHRTLETLSKNIETWAANADSFSLNFICTYNYTTSVAQRLVSNAKNRMIMSENTTVEQLLDRIERLLRGQKTILNFAKACEFTGLHVQAHPPRANPPFQTPRQEHLFQPRGVETVAAAKSRQEGRTERTRSRRLHRPQTTTEVAFHPACSGSSERVGFSIN